MDFRTEIETPRRPVFEIDHDTPVLMLGSCFTDNVGELLERDGFDVVHNPMGTLYNPASICRALRLAKGIEKPHYLRHENQWHCMDFATKYTSADLDKLQAMVNADLKALSEALDRAKVVIITLGTAFVFEMSFGNGRTGVRPYTEGDPSEACGNGRTGVRPYTEGVPCVVGNCHKLPAAMFQRRCLGIVEAAGFLLEICGICRGKQVIFTVSPIRHTADGLHGNQISKATLLLAIEKAKGMLAEGAGAPLYFPAYEIMLDDLRDYRFYAADMKHPSPVAIDYIYEKFAQYYFTQPTIDKAAQCRKAYKRLMHRPINDATDN